MTDELDRKGLLVLRSTVELRLTRINEDLISEALANAGDFPTDRERELIDERVSLELELEH